MAFFLFRQNCTARSFVVSGKPDVASINSSPEGLYRHSYNLTWTVRSREPLTEVRLLFRRLVRKKFALNMYR